MVKTMYIVSILCSIMLAANSAEALRSGSKVKLSNVQSLTLRKDLQTSHRRVEALPQLKCIGGSAKGKYEVDVMRCKNSGSDYDEDSIQWTCTASLPEEFKLGSTDVICEGYDYPEDPYILKGSCGVEYRLVLTDRGRKKYGDDRWGSDDDNHGRQKTAGEKFMTTLFWAIFIAIGLWIVYSAIMGAVQGPTAGAAGGNRPGWGGGGGGHDTDNDPPPPYYSSDPRKQQSRYGGTEGWRPGFWSGALGGAAAGYTAGRMGNNSTRNTGSNGGYWNNGEGSSRSSSGSSGSSFSGTRHESTGFGSTSRR